MKQIVYICMFFFFASCGQSSSEQEDSAVSDTTSDIKTSDIDTESIDTVGRQNLSVEQKHDVADFLPKGYVVFEKISGDLNKDNIEDAVLIIKGTDPNEIITDEYRGVLDRNRRGIIILFNSGIAYKLAVKNHDCFSSENEDGGVYFAPELSVYIQNSNLHVHYAHGRYGYWKYTFRYQNNDFELIGYDESSNRGPIVQYETSINFLSKKKLIRDNLNKHDDVEDIQKENFKETWEKITVKELFKLSKIKDFDELNMTVY